MSDLRTFEQIQDSDAESVGGKGLSLGRMSAAGLPVPPGFCVTTAAYRRLRGQSLAGDAALVEQIIAAYRQLGGWPGRRAFVRHSARMEPSPASPGSRRRFSACAARRTCAPPSPAAGSRCTPNAPSPIGDIRGSATTGWRWPSSCSGLVHAEVAGVLFTRDPLDAEGRRMLVEASWGLGESVVSGKVEPDRYHLDRETGHRRRAAHRHENPRSHGRWNA